MPSVVRVLLVVSSNRLAGTERHVADLADGLRRAGIDACVACGPGPGGLAALLARRGVPVQQLGFSHSRVPGATLLLARSARDFDLLHSHLTVATMAAAGAGLLAHRPVVETRHFVALAYQGRGTAGRLAGAAVRRLLQRRVAVTVVPSRAVQRVTDGPSIVIAHGVDLGERDRATPLGAGRFVTACRLDRDRNVELLVRAFATARSRLPAHASLTVVGDGTCRPHLQQLAHQLGLSDHVVMTGWLDDPQPRLAAADVYLAAPFWPAPESFGMSILDAMGAGLAVIAEPGGGADDLVVPEVTGLLVAPEVDLWAQAMIRLGTDAELAATMGAAARGRAQQDFDLAHMVDRTVEMYREVLAASSAGPGRRRVSNVE